MRTGAPPEIVCTRGHQMTVTRKRHLNGDTYCAACKKIRHDTFRKQNPERVSVYNKNHRRRKLYGLESQKYRELLSGQEEMCAVCYSSDWGSRGPHIDHDHITGKIRGLLCHCCNTAMGLFKENPIIFKSAINYLEGAR